MCCRFPWNPQMPEPLLFLWKVALWRKVSKKPAFLQVLLWISDDYVLAHWEFQDLFYSSLSPSWLYPWWEDHDFENVCLMLVGCVLELLCPHKGPRYCFCWAGRGPWCWSLTSCIELQVCQMVSRAFVSGPGGSLLPSGPDRSCKLHGILQ